jgi:hypothetical protein
LFIIINKMDKSKLLTLFKENLVKFFDALIEQFPKEGDFILLRLLCDQLPSSLIINTFANRILPYTDLIKQKNEKFFLESEDLFAGMPKSKVNYFKNIWLSETLKTDDRDELWKWFHLFANLALKYKQFE